MEINIESSDANTKAQLIYINNFLKSIETSDEAIKKYKDNMAITLKVSEELEAFKSNWSNIGWRTLLFAIYTLGMSIVTDRLFGGLIGIVVAVITWVVALLILWLVLTVAESNYKRKANEAFNNMRDAVNEVYSGTGVIIGTKRILLDAVLNNELDLIIKKLRDKEFDTVYDACEWYRLAYKPKVNWTWRKLRQDSISKRSTI